MKLDAPKNSNYAATIVAVHTLIELEGLDNLEVIKDPILKAKSPKFLEHETRLLDKDEVDMESAA